MFLGLLGCAPQTVQRPRGTWVLDFCSSISSPRRTHPLCRFSPFARTTASFRRTSLACLLFSHHLLNRHFSLGATRQISCPIFATSSTTTPARTVVSTVSIVSKGLPNSLVRRRRTGGMCTHTGLWRSPDTQGSCRCGPPPLGSPPPSPLQPHNLYRPRATPFRLLFTTRTSGNGSIFPPYADSPRITKVITE